MTAGLVIANRYEVLSRLGEGGMGTVYRALDRVLARPVAIKTLRQPMVGDRQRQRFMTEARSAAALNHPNIVTIHDFGNDDTQPFIVMELVEGPTLAALIEEGRALTILQKLDYVRDVGKGLEHAHQHRVLHLDIKPSNVIVDSRQVAKILDFGIARMSDEATFTSMHGTPCYMAPEQVYGQPDQRSDIFAMGALLYELVSGTRAFPSSPGGGLLDRVLNADYEPLTESVVTHIPGIELVIDRTLAKNPGDRYQTVGEFNAAVEALRSRVADTTIEAGHVGSPHFPQPSAVGEFRRRMLAARSPNELRRLKYEVEQFLSNREQDIDARVLRDDIERALLADGSLSVRLDASGGPGSDLPPGKTAAGRLRYARYILTAFTVVFFVGTFSVVRYVTRPATVAEAPAPALPIELPPPAPPPPEPVDPNRAIVDQHLAEARVKLDAKDFAHALKDHLLPVLELEPENTTALAMRKEVEDAFLGSVTTIKPPPPVGTPERPLVSVGEIRLRVGGIPRRNDESQAEYTARVNRVQTEFADGKATLEKGDYVTAVSHFRNVQREQPGYQGVEVLISDTQARQQKAVDDAVKNGQTYESLNRKRDARLFYRQALTIDPSATTARERENTLKAQMTAEADKLAAQASAAAKLGQAPKAIGLYQQIVDMMLPGDEAKDDAERQLQTLKQ